MATKKDAKKAFASTFSVEDWQYLCSKTDFNDAVKAGQLVEAKELAKMHLFHFSCLAW